MEQHDYIVLLEKFFKKEASSEERRILIEWIRKPGIRNEFNLLCEQMWKEAAVEIDKTVEEEMWNHLQRNLDEPKILSPKKRRWQPIIYKVAATILLPVCLGLATYFGVEHMNKVSQDPFMVAVDYGQKANLTLPDGTKVWLNSATHLSYDAEYNKSDRKIYLDGEAYFEVSKDQKHPFIVQTEHINVQVLGTHFNVDAYRNNPEVKTTLLTGSVAVSNKSNSVRMILKPNEIAIYNKVGNKLTRQVTKNAKDEISWRDGEFIFDNLPLGEIARELSNSFDTPIHIADTSLQSYRISARFRNGEDLETILSVEELG